MVTNMLYGGPFRDMRLLQEEVNRLAQSAAAQSGLEPGLLQKMLPMLAMLISVYLAKQQGAGPDGGGLGGLLGGLLGGRSSGESASPGAGMPGLASMLDMNGDGNPLDDILRMAGKITR